MTDVELGVKDAGARALGRCAIPGMYGFEVVCASVAKKSAGALT